MNVTSPKQKNSPGRWIFIIAVLASGFIFWRWQNLFSTDAGKNSASPPPAASTNQKQLSRSPSGALSVPVQPVATNRPAAIAGRLPVPQFSWFQAHPFKAAETNGAYAWTAEDGKDTNVIRQLAHNELEYQRMVNENGTIFRRQLVYHPEGFTLLAQQALQSGHSVQALTLPGLDGRELQVTVTRTDFESGGDRGLFYGKLPGRPDSMVTAAFINGEEAFTVISPQDQIYLQGEAREPGEIIVKSVDPGTYGGQSD